MNTKGAEVVIVGGGLVGTATSYYLGRAGVESVVVEQDEVGSHASGAAFGLLGTMEGAGIPDPTSAVREEGLRLHRHLADTLPQDTGVNIGFRERALLSLAFTEEEADAAKTLFPSQPEGPAGSARWVDAGEARAIEPRISEAAIGGVYTEQAAEVDSYSLVVALAQAAEKLGATRRRGRVTGLRRDGALVRGVVLEHDEIPCGHLVLAMGPWSGQASAWLGVPIRVRPVKGQILRLRAPGPPYECCIDWSGNYMCTKPDGLLWAGTTEEEAGFDERPTSEAREHIMARLLKALPALTDAQLVRQTACLRPVSDDGLLLLGKAPGWEGVFMATGAGRQGIGMGPAMGRIAAELVMGGTTDLSIDAFDPGRFVG
jgi:glycine oxidase